MKFLHELDDAEELYRAVAYEKDIEPYLVEKDYWIMHALWGLHLLMIFMPQSLKFGKLAK